VEPVDPARRAQIERLSAPIAWRPALQVGDAGYRVPKPVLRGMIARAERPRA
jgi:hypothetical protein